MSKEQGKRSLWDDVVEGVRDVADALGRMLNPDRQPKRAPVPIPIRANPPLPQRRPRQ